MDPLICSDDLSWREYDRVSRCFLYRKVETRRRMATLSAAAASSQRELTKAGFLRALRHVAMDCSHLTSTSTAEAVGMLSTFRARAVTEDVRMRVSLMKRFLFALAATVGVTLPAFAGDVGVSVSVGEPGFYGRI